MAKPDPSDVTAGFDTSLDDADVSEYIDDAGVLLRKAYDASELDDADETAMWKYLVRHLIRFTSKDRQMEQKGLGSAQVQYSGNFGEMLRGTSPGQMVLMLDDEDRFEDLTGESEDLFFRSV